MCVWAAGLACFGSANNASPETYDVVLCSGGVIQVQLVGSAGMSFEVNTADNWPIARVDDAVEPGCADYAYASVSDDGQVVASTEAVGSNASREAYDYRADLRKLGAGFQVARRRLLDLEAVSDAPVPVPIPPPLPSGERSVMRNLVVLVRFADHVNRCLPSVSDMDKLFNSDTYTYDAGGNPVRPLPLASAEW